MSFDEDLTWVKEEIKKTKSVNINRANLEELTKLPGVGKVLAARIIEHRKTEGFFTNKADIKKIKGIGQKKFEKMKEFILLG